MQKFLRTMMLIALLAVPFASQAQMGTGRTYLNEDFSVANPEGWVGGTSEYAPTFQATGAPSWTYTEYDLNGLAAGHYYYNLFAPARYQWLVSPEMDLTESGEAELRFDLALTAFSGTAAPADVDSGKVIMVLIRYKGNTPGAAWGNWQVIRKWVKNPAEGELDIMSLTAAYTNDTVDMEAYLGKYAQVAFYCENTTTRATSVNIHVDNVVCDGKIRVQQPTDLEVVEVGTTTVTLAWTDELNPQVDHYLVRAIAGEDTLTQNTVGSATNIVFGGLQGGTTYRFDVRTYATASDFSENWSASVSTMTHYANPAEPDFVLDFEDGYDGWLFANDANNGWYYGTEVLASHNTDSVFYFASADSIFTEGVFDSIAEGADTLWHFTVVPDSVNHVLWVSNDNGAHNTYTTSGAQVSYAYLPVLLDSGDYNVRFDWRNVGESGYDFLRMMLVEETATLTPGTVAGAEISSPNFAGEAEWQNVHHVFTVGSDGIYKLVLMWRNDNGDGDNPAASVDNIVVSRVICFPVQNLAQNDSLTAFNAIALDWEDPLEVGTYRIVAIGGGDTIEVVAENPEMPYVLTDAAIKAETTYAISVYTVCGENGESNPASCSATTFKACEPVTELAAEPTRGNVTLTWVDNRNVEATYDVIVKQGADTVAAVEGVESGVVVAGLTPTTDYTATVIAHSNDTTARSLVNFSTGCVQGVVSNCNTYTFNLVDSYGDGWNNGQLRVLVNGEQQGSNMTIASGSAASYTMEFCAGDVVEVQYKSGSYASENSYTVVDPDGNVLYSSGSCTTTSNFTTKYSFTAVARLVCDDVELVVAVTDRTADGASFAWENPLNEDATEYNVVIKAGTDTVVNETVTDTTIFTTTALDPSTNYTVVVSAVYEDGFVFGSEPVVFETRGPCNAPENFEAVATHASIALSWTQDQPTIESYQLYYDTAEVENLADLEEVELIPVSGNEGYTIQNLDDDVTYYIYFRANCGENPSAWRDATAHTLPYLECGEYIVANGTTTNSYVPVYGTWLDAQNTSQSIYPASMLENLVGSTINSMTYYSNGTSSYSKLAGKPFEVSLAITSNATMPSGWDATPRTVVYYGELSINDDGTMAIVFDTPYQYNGGNLLVTVRGNEAGNSGYASLNFYGISQTGGSRYKYNDYNMTATSPSSANFLAKINFAACKAADACAAVEITVSDVDYNTATLSWERPDSKVNGYLLVVSDTAVVDPSAVEATELGDITEYVFANLTENSDHYVYLATLCGDSDTSAWATATFATPAFCRVAANLAAELTAKNAATLSWEGTDSTQAANYSYILDTVALSEDSLANYAGTIVTDINTTVVDVANLAYNTTYYLYVRNVCELGGDEALAPWVGPATFTTIQEMTDVMDLALEVYRNEVTATWAADSANFATDSLWRIAIVGHDSVPTTWSTVNTPTYTWTGLEWDTVYDVYVAAFNGTITSDTVVASATIGLGMPVVLNLATSVYRNEITATWEIDPNGLDTAWAVAVRKVNDSSDLVWVNVDTTEHTFVGLEYDTLYNVYVKALYLDMESDSVVKTNVHTHIAMPNVTGIYVNPLSHNYAQVNWQRGNNEAVETEWAFAIKAASDTNEFVYTTIDHMDTMIYGLEELTTYQVKIAALWNGMSSDTVAYSFTTPSKASALSSCMTVANGTTTNNYVPVYGFYCDAYNNAQFVYPASYLEEMTGKPLSSMKFYASQSSVSWGSANFKVYMAETSNATISNFANVANMTLVYDGSLSISGNEMNVNFENPYTYNGGNLLVAFVQDATGSYVTSSWYGISSTGSSVQGYNYSSVSSISATQRNFLPKVSFCYEGQYIQDLAVDSITETSAEASWMPGGHETEWQYVNAEGELTAAELEAAEKTTVTEQNVALTALTADKDYTFYIRAHEVIDSTFEVVYVFDSIHTWYDTTYSKENPLEMVVITHNDSIMKVAYDTACVYSVDTAAVLPTGKIAIDTIMSVVDPTADSLYVYNDTTCTYSVIYDTLLNQDWYSDWCKVSYTTLKTCELPTYFRVNGYNADSAAVVALTEANALNFHYAVKGSDEYITVAGILDTVYDTVDAEIVYDTNILDSTWVGYDANGQFVMDTVPFAGYDYNTYQMSGDAVWMDPVESIYMLPRAIDTVYTIDTIPYFYAYLTPLATNTTYVVAAQSVCGEGDASRWTEEEEFTTLNNCTGTIELPYTENFDGATSYVDCWNVVKDENEYELGDSLDYEITYYSGQYRLFPAGNVADHDFIPAEGEARYDRYVVSPEFEATEAITKWTSSLMVNTYYVDGNDYSRDSVAFGYSTTNDSIESFTWTEFRSYAGSYNTNWSNVELLPAGVKYVAYHFVGEKPDWMALNSMDIHVADFYTVNAYNGNAGMGTVTMIEDGDTLEMADVYSDTVVEGTAMKLVAEPEHGYRFTGWERINSENHRVNASNSATLNFTAADTTLIATFAINQNTVVATISNANYGTAKITVPADTNAFKAEHNTVFTLTATDTVLSDNMVFRGWSLNNNANNIVSYENPYTFNLDAATNNQTQTYTAMFVQDSFTVAVNYNHEMGVVTVNGRTVESDSLNVGLSDTGAIHMAATINYGYEFVNWTNAAGEEITTELNFDTASHDAVNLVFNANFQKIPFYIQVASNDETKGTAAADTNAGLYLAPIVLTAEATAEHYHFQYWSDGVTDNPYNFILTQDTNMIAFFAIDTHMVKVVSDTANFGYVTINGVAADSLYFNYGTTNIELEAIPNTGVAFTAWSDGETANPRVIDVLNMDTTFTATFDSIVYTIALDVNDVEGSIEDVDGLTGKYLDTLTFVAEANPGYRFVAWHAAENTYYGDTLNYVITDAEEQIVSAEFTEAGKVNINVAVNILEAGSVLIAGQSTIEGVAVDTTNIAGYIRFDSLSTVTLTATAAEHYHFLNWTSADTVLSTEAETEVEGIYGDAMNFVANFEIDTHLVKAIAENGTFTYNGVAADSVYVDYGSNVVVTPVAAANYHFVAWADETEDTVRTIEVLTDTTIEALFAIDTHFVTVAVNNELFGTATIAEGYNSLQGEDTAWYDFGDTAILVATSNVGYHLVNWSTGATTDTIALPVYSSNLVIANFDTNVYNVTLVAENGTIAGPATAKHFTTATYVATANYGYHFNGWVNAESETDTVSVDIVSDTTITANFAKNSYVVTAAANDDELGTVAGTDTVLYLDTVTLIATANEGYHVENWSNGMTGDTIYVVADSNITVTANFVKNVYAAAVVFDATKGTATVSNAAPEYLDTITFIATPAAHYTFNGWSNGMTEDTIEVVVVSDTTLTANFEAIMRTITVNSADTTMGTVTPAGDSAVIEGSSFTAVANANDGYHFVNWSTGDTTASITVTVDSNMTLTANFAANYVPPVQFTVVLTSANSAMGTVSAGATVDSGANFTATATPAQGYHFVAWINGTDTASTDAVYTFVVTSDINLVAHFAADSTPVQSYTVTVQVNGQGTVIGDGQYEEGAECVLVARPAAGYRFVEWRNGDQVLGTDTIYAFTVTANITIVAVFEQDGIENVDMSNVNIYSTDSKIIVNGAENQSIYVFDVNGRVMATEANAAETCEFRMATTGVYLVKVGNAPAKRVLVVR